MTNREIAVSLREAAEMESKIRRAWDSAPKGSEEQAVSQAAMRQVAGLRKSLEKWIAQRAIDSALAS